MKIPGLLISVVLFNTAIFAQDLEVRRVEIGTKSIPDSAEVKLTLIARFQHYTYYVKNNNDVYDKSVNSPKSVLILEEKNKFYVNNLESLTTSVYDLGNLNLIKIINHRFSSENAFLFKDTTLFDYKFNARDSHFNIFKGKPVEGCFSHDKKYLWVTYYRRTFDLNAVDPSAVAIIDTDKDEIVRVMPTAPLPKMIACSPDNNYIAVTHWGDNTVGIIDISSNNINDFKYVNLFEVGKRLILNYDNTTKIDRDKNCGYCLRGTVFSTDSKYLLVGRMGGGGIAVFDMVNMTYIKSVFGMKTNIRHLTIKGDQLFISTNVTGYVQKANVNELINHTRNSDSNYTKWSSKYVGKGARTIAVSSDGNYIFAAVNNESKVLVLRAKDMNIISTINVDSFPVGMDIKDDNTMLIVTSQGKVSCGGGQSVMVFRIDGL